MAKNHFGVIGGIALAVGSLAIGVGPSSAASTEPIVRSQTSSTQDLFQRCEHTEHNEGACISGINGAQVFSGPNQLAPAPPYTLANPSNEWTYGCVNNQRNPPRPFPREFAANGTEVSAFTAIFNCYYDGRFSWEIIARADWVPPAPLPQGDVASIHFNNEAPDQWEQGAVLTQIGSPDFWCAPSQFTQCDVIHSSQSFHQNLALDSQNTWLTFYTNSVYQIRNLPFIVQIKNNLPAGDHDDLVMDGSPEVSQFIMDPNGGNPQTIKAGESGYFGLYAMTATGTAKQGFSVTYNVGPQSSDIAGSSISLDIVIDPKTGALDNSSKCTFNVSEQNQAGTCSISLLGGPRAAQTLFVNVYE